MVFLLSACVQPSSGDGAGGKVGGSGGAPGAGGGAGTSVGAGGSSGGAGVSGGAGGQVGGGGGGGSTGSSGGRSGAGGSVITGSGGSPGPVVSVDGGTRPDLTGRKALFIVDDPTSLDDGDVLFQQLLQVRGMTVTLGTVAGPASLATGFHVVIGSGGASATDFATVFKDVAVPMILFGNSYLQPMGMVAAPNANRGNAAGTVQATIVDATTPLSSDLAMGSMFGVIDSTIVNTQLYWGTPLASAIKIAAVVGAPTQFIDFAYEKGAALAVGTAAARRVTLGWKASAIQGLFLDSFKLQDAAVSWTAGAP